MIRRVWLAGFLVGLGCAGNAAAQALAARAGTTGFGADFSLSLAQQFGLRGTLYGGSVSDRTTESGIRYESKVRFGTAMALADFFPGAGRFRLSAGLAYNDNRIDLTARDGGGGTVEIGANTYNLSDVGPVTGRVRFDRVNPYIGLGWGNAARSFGPGLFFSGDIGLMRVKPKVSLSANCRPPLTPAQCAQLE
ncbi:MAG: hypothetical protein NZL99_08460, partial [Burkholderiaceae bacterium]|nr:hypothetical protein [Burkholderiaceae bacterium]